MRATTSVRRATRLASTASELATEQLRRGPQPLAPPPRGSGLLPVMGDPGLPLVGQTLQIMRDPIGMARERRARFGLVSWGRSFGIRMVAVLGAEGTEEVLVNRDRAFSQGGWEYFIGPFFTRGLMLLDFEEHHHHRRIMQEAFTSARLAGYLDGMNDVIADGLASWPSRDGFAFHPAFKQLTLDLATRVFVGHPLGSEANRINKAFFDTVQAGTALVRLDVPGGRWHAGLAGRRVLEDFFRAEVPAKRAGSGSDLFTALAHAEVDGHRFSDEDIVNHMIFLLMAAHDTSTATMTSLVYELARSPQWQDRLREEARTIGRGTIEVQGLRRLPLLANAIKEAQRIITPVPALPRRAVKDTSVLGHYIPEGTLVFVSPLATHHMDDYFTDPMSFDPDRFSDERREDKSHRYAWAPFGGGTHKCIGMHFGNLEVSAAMHQLLLGFRWSVSDDYVMPVNRMSLPYPSDGLPLRLTRLDANPELS